MSKFYVIVIEDTRTPSDATIREALRNVGEVMDLLVAEDGLEISSMSAGHETRVEALESHLQGAKEWDGEFDA